MKTRVLVHNDGDPAHSGVSWPTRLAALLAVLLLAGTASAQVILSPASGFNITWDGNNGEFFSPSPDAGPSNNVALASNGTVAFGSSEFDGGGVHLIANINDGLYGNSHSWISAFTVPDPDPFIGIAFASSVDVSSIAWGRDNGNATTDACGAACTDRFMDTYTIQFTQIAAPDAATADTGDATTGWETLGTIQYVASDASFIGHLRHRFEVDQGGAPIAATGLRFKVANPGTAMDEIEVNPIPEPPPVIDNYIEITSAPGFMIEWDGNEGNFSTPDSPALAPPSAASAATAFGSSEFGAGVHLISHINDGQYGNSYSWISAFTVPDPDPFIGMNFGDCIEIRNIAWSRDNGDDAEFMGVDRTFGVYTIQVTSVADADATTLETGSPASGWVTIGTVEYKANDPEVFISHLRHRFDVAAADGPILATALRIKVSDPGIAIDEIEVNVAQVLEDNLVLLTPEPGFNISWDGNEGEFFSPDTGAGPSNNVALASNGTVPYASSELGPLLSIPFHVAANLNDGFYGNSFSWISANGVGGTTDPDPWAMLGFASTVDISSIAWGRDNGDTTTEGTFTDRGIDTYTLQYTQVPSPDTNTVDTGDAATGWQTFGTVQYTADAADGSFISYLRHRFEVDQAGSPISATGLRIKVANGLTDIDEIEVNPQAAPPPAEPQEPTAPIVLTPQFGYEISYDGNDGDFNNPQLGAAPPDNAALTSTPFGSSQLDLGVHLIVAINDGFYGNANSWISGDGDPLPFVGLNFGGSVAVTNLAWGRDNGNTVTDACGGTCTDRALGLYTLQVTQVPSPDETTVDTGDAATGWVTVGTIDYQGEAPGLFTSYLRHRFEVSEGGGPIFATGMRLIVPVAGIAGGTAIDEIEINTAVDEPGPILSIELDGADAIVSWDGGGRLEAAPSVEGPWTDWFNFNSSPYRVPVGATGMQFFRVRK